MTQKFSQSQSRKSILMSTTTAADKELSLSDRLETYLERHAVKMQMNTNYLLDAFTIQSVEDRSSIVGVMDSVKAEGKHVTYRDYITKSKDQIEEMPINEGRHFALFKRKSAESQIVQIAKRSFGSMYSKSLPVMSKDQRYVCLPRFSTRGKISSAENFLDIYNCEDLNFWCQEHDLVPHVNDSQYICTLKISEEDRQDFNTVRFSLEKKYVVVRCKTKFLIYDLDAVENNPQVDQKTQTRDIDSIIDFKLRDLTYDRILNIYLYDHDLNESWVVLQSSQYDQVHVLKLRDVLASKEQTIKKKTLGGQFITVENQEEILFKVSTGDIPNFWENVLAKFSKDGKKVTVTTLDETYLLLLDALVKDKYLKYAKIPYLKGKEVDQFHRGDNSILFSERDMAGTTLQLSALELEKKKNFSNTRIPCRGKIVVKEIIEFKREYDNQLEDVLRVTAIRNSEELMQWEVIGHCKGKPHYRSLNSSKLGSFRWPFYAYANGQTISLNLLYEPQYIIHHKLELSDADKKARILQIEFAHEGDLYLLCLSKKQYIYYRIRVKKDMHQRNTKRQLVDNEQSELESDYEQQEQEDSNVEIQEEIFRREKIGPSIKYWHPYVQKTGLELLVIILELRGNQLHLLTIQGEDRDENPVFSDLYRYKVKSIIQINKNNFIIHEDTTNNLRMLTVNYQGTSYFTEKLIFRDTTHNITKVLANKNRLYVMSQSGTEYILRCFSLDEASLELNPTGTLQNVEKVNPTFIEDFERSTRINSNILISNELKFVKIYDNNKSEHGEMTPTLQNYFNFLPDPKDDEKDRAMPALNIRNCQKHDRLLMTFNYPGSCKPKEILVTPYIGDNSIGLNMTDYKDTITWIQNKQIEESVLSQTMKTQTKASEAQKQSLTKILKYKPSAFKLQEFDLVGILKRQTSFKSNFNEIQVLAQCSQKLRYLVTPQAREYLEKIQIMEIFENHTCSTIREFKTTEIKVKIANQEFKLFDLMYLLKSTLDCSFDFKLNCKEQEIVLASFLPKGQLCAAFVIRKDLQESPLAHMIFMSEKHEQAQLELISMKNVLQDNARQNLLRTQQTLSPRAEELKKFCRDAFLKVTNFVVSENKVIFWNKSNILHGNLQSIRGAGEGDIKKIYLTKSLFEINTVLSMKDKKASKNLKNQLLASVNQELDEVLKSSKDYIQSIFVHNKSSKKGVKIEQEEVLIKVSCGDNEVFLVLYEIDKDTEITSLSCSKQSEVFFNSDQDFMVADFEVGIINIESKEVLHEYHLQRNWPEQMQQIDLSFGRKIVRTIEASYFILPNQLVMPYSMLSVIQQFQAEAYDNVTANFYTEDYYKLEGSTQAHKFMYNPILLEKLLDDYWKQNNYFITTILVKQESGQELIAKDYGTSLINSQALKVGQKIAKDIDIYGSLKRSSKVKINVIEENDVVDAQIEMNSDLLINKILYYLSKMPIQYSFQRMQPKLRKVASYARFIDYLDSWPVQTSQMQSTRVLYTELEAGFHQEYVQCQFLSKEFFIKHPTEQQEQTQDIQEIQQQQDEFPEDNDDYFQRAPKSSIVEDERSNSQKDDVEDADEADDDDEGKRLQQVDIKMLQVDWLTKTKDGKKFLKEIIKNPDCLTLFESETMTAQVDFMWTVCKPFFIRYRFIPFIFLGALPLTVMSFMVANIAQFTDDDEGAHVISYFVFYCSVFLFSLNTLSMTYIEVKEIYGKKRYFKQGLNYLQLLTITCNLTLIFISFFFSGKSAKQMPDQEKTLDLFRNLMVFCVIFNICELIQRVTIFDFFAKFVRQLYEISLESLPLGSMLGIIVVCQTLVFWILDQNSTEPKYPGIDGFGNCFIDSYRLALGDFEMSVSFIENTDGYQIIAFWFVFFCATILSLLIILNMVIAVMSTAFTKVEEQQAALIYRSKLSLIMENYGWFLPSQKNELKQNKYILQIEVDPDVDVIEQESQETRLSQQIQNVKGYVKLQADRLTQVSLNLDTLYDRLCSETTKQYKSKDTEFDIDDDDKNNGNDQNDSDDEQGDEDSDVDQE